MMTFDIHQHLTFGTDIDKYADGLRKNKVRAAVCSCGPAFAQPGNPAVAKALKKHPDVIVGLGFIGLGRGDTPKTVQKLYDQGFKGLKMIIPKKDYDDKSYFPIYRKAEELKMPILFHTGIMAGTEGLCEHYKQYPEVAAVDHSKLDISSRRMEPITLDLVARNFPKLMIIMAHFTSENRKESISGMINWLPNVYTDLTNCTWYFPRKHTIYMANLLKQLMGKNVPRYKLLFGSDADSNNLSMLAKQVKTVKEILDLTGWSKEDKELIMGGTMNKVFGFKD